MLKKISYLVISFIIFIVGSSALLFSSGVPPQNATGAPGPFGANTCATSGCHSDNVANSGGGNISVSGLPGTYSSNGVYNFSLTITHSAANRTRWGFSIVAKDGAGNSVGTWSTTNPNTAANGPELSHSNGPVTASQSVYTFNNLTWTAPAISTGNITFYYAGLAADGSSSTGDFTYTNTQAAVVPTAPTADAGSDVIIFSPASIANLSGSGTGSNVTYLWTKLNGPAGDVIASATSASTSVSGLVQAVYEYQLQVTDNIGQIATDAMTITVNAIVPSVNNVGIGTLTPKHKLEVAGNIWLGLQQSGADFASLDDALYLGSPRKYLSNTLGTPIDGNVDWINLMAHPFSKGIMFGLSGPSDADPHTGPTPLMVVRSDGNVGIGTTTFSVGEKLAIAQNNLQFGIYPGYLDNTPNADWTTFEMPGGKMLRIWDGLSVASNVGIGTTLPNTQLDIKGADAAITVGTVGLTGGALYMGNPNHGLQRGFPTYAVDNNVGLYTTAGNIYLSTNGTAAGEFVLTDGGNVGIGISPGAKFQVNGSTILTNTSDNTGGNVSIGDVIYSNVKLTVRTNQSYGIFIDAPSTPGGNALYVDGSAAVTGTLSKGGGSFKIDHPLDPANKFLYHSFVESPDMMNVYNGNVVTDDIGLNTITLPDYFEALNKDFRYQLTVIGSFAQAIVLEEVSENKFIIKTDKPNIKVSWQVTGIRHDAFADKNRIPNSIDKVGSEKGLYLHPGAFGLPEELNIKKAQLIPSKSENK